MKRAPETVFADLLAVDGAEEPRRLAERIVAREMAGYARRSLHVTREALTKAPADRYLLARVEVLEPMVQRFEAEARA